MIIIGCDFHTRYQQIAMANDETGELLLERRLDHQSGEAHEFYRSLLGLDFSVDPDNELAALSPDTIVVDAMSTWDTLPACRLQPKKFSKPCSGSCSAI
jgi:hypothetical protein